MFARTQTDCLTQYKIQVKSCVTWNDFPIPQYVKRSPISSKLKDDKTKLKKIVKI